MNTFQKFIKITKIDEEEHMIFGWASTEDIDSDGEIIKASALEKALPEYLKFPTIREMHQPIAVGKTTAADVKKKDGKKGLYIGAKIVAADAWQKVKEGVYPAFSIGGNVLKRIGNVIHELELVEISLVDVPANKAAVVEVWKRGKLSKDAETAYSMANLMIQVKDTISYYKYLGKDTKKLEKVLEQLKAILAVEASEPEGNYDGIFAGRTEVELEKKIAILEAMDFSTNPYADIIRKGVTKFMSKAIKKQDDPKEAEETAEEKTEAEEESTEEETAEEETEEKAEEKSEAKGELETTLQKIQDTNKKLEKLQPSKEDEKQSTDIVKALGSLAGSFAKLADTLVSIEERVVKLENTPAKTKSKSAVVLKAKPSEEFPEDGETTESKILAIKRARVEELKGKLADLGPNEFAKQGLSKEAMRLQDEIAALELKIQA
jgi:HK97 family phage prohead protease